MSGRGHWQRAESELRALVEAGQTYAEIGRHFGYSENATATAAHRLGIKVPYAVKSARAAASRRLAWQDDTYRAYMSEASRRQYHGGHGKRLHVTGEGSRLKWLPAAYREQYFWLTKRGHCRAAEAKAMILDDIARDEARAAATAAAAARAYSRSWAGQLERAARLGVTELPVYQTAEHSFSLTGSTLS